MATKLIRSPRIDERYACFRLEIRESKIHRLGIYALEHIPANRKVIEYTGERIRRREAKRRNGRFTYLFELDKYWILDGAVGGSGAEIMNHCCEPNIRSQIMRGHILFMSMRRIEAGEELTLDYRFDHTDERVKCRCGAENCRGVINLKED
jgi:SET domain-containing protein